MCVHYICLLTVYNFFFFVYEILKLISKSVYYTITGKNYGMYWISSSQRDRFFRTFCHWQYKMSLILRFKMFKTNCCSTCDNISYFLNEIFTVFLYTFMFEIVFRIRRSISDKFLDIGIVPGWIWIAYAKNSVPRTERCRVVFLKLILHYQSNHLVVVVILIHDSNDELSIWILN